MTLLLVLIVGVVLAVSVFLTAMLWRFQERIVFQPPAWRPIVNETEASARQVQYRAQDGVSLFAWIVGENVPDGAVVLAFHGNAELARWQIPWAVALSRMTNACVVVAEYRGYDGIPGDPSYVGSGLDSRAALRFVRDEMHVSPERLVYFGHSLGSAIAAELTTVQQPRSLVLQSPFSSARELSRRFIATVVPGVWGLISRVHFDTIARVSALDAPVWVSHGDHDVVIPVRMGRAVFEAAAHKGELLIIRGAGHNDLAEAGGGAYRDWLTRAVGPQSATRLNSVAREEKRSAP